MGRLAYIYHLLFEQHDPGPGHPESPARLRSIQEFLKQKGFFNNISVVSPEPVPLDILELAHEKKYIKFIQAQSGKNSVVLDGGDTLLSADSSEAAFLAAGAGVKAMDLVFDEGYDKVFAAVRPPGHHAFTGAASGFCVFNNIAVAARYAVKHKNIKKVLIIDWDVHHGNGTQASFYYDPAVFYFSMHQYPFYPMSGRSEETGAKKGSGFTLNIPLSAGCDDSVYVDQLGKFLENLESFFRPELILISAGFDAYYKDPLGGMRVTAEGFYKLTEIVSHFAQRHCGGRIISFLEGGYNLNGLAECVHQHLQCLLKH